MDLDIIVRNTMTQSIPWKDIVEAGRHEGRSTRLLGSKYGLINASVVSLTA